MENELPEVLYARPYMPNSEDLKTDTKPENLSVPCQTIEAGEYVLKRIVKITSTVGIEGK